jgi:hypothetical protein
MNWGFLSRERITNSGSLQTLLGTAAEDAAPKFSGLLKGIAEEINLRFPLG